MRDMGQLTHIECHIKRAKWTQVLDVLKVSAVQQEQLMANRKEHLNKLRKVYQERQELNMQVCAASSLLRLKGTSGVTMAAKQSHYSSDSSATWGLLWGYFGGQLWGYYSGQTASSLLRLKCNFGVTLGLLRWPNSLITFSDSSATLGLLCGLTPASRDMRLLGHCLLSASSILWCQP